MPTIITDGAASAQGYGFAARSVAANYIEDVFSTYLYTGTGASLTITNGIDLSTKGGLVWIKQRSGAQDHTIFDTARGVNNYLRSNSTGAQNPGGTYTDLLTAFNSSGFSLGADASTAGFVNASGSTYVSWTFRKQAKFFDVVTYTGNGTARTIAHNLGSVPGCIFVKKTSGTGNWVGYHRSLTSAAYTVLLNTTDAQMSDSAVWNSTAPTSTVFSVGGSTGGTNDSGETYVAYLFAHDAGGFGTTGADNVISCGSYTGNGTSYREVSIGWEPQWILVKRTDTGINGAPSGIDPADTNWFMFDNMRGMPVGATTNKQILASNKAAAEVSDRGFEPYATGFRINQAQAGYNASGGTYIYIAIRRGPMRTPTTGTSVFLPSVSSTVNPTFTTGFNVDMSFVTARAGWARQAAFFDRLRGATQTLESSNTSAESGGISTSKLDLSNAYYSSASSAPLVSYALARAPGFFDVVCYTGDGTNPRNITHNLGVPPELMIVKRRGPTTQNWLVYHSAIGAAAGLNLNLTSAAQNPAFFWSATPTATQFSTQLIPNAASENYVTYLFATVAGVSKVGSYTGTGTTNQINCGFTAGARFVLIKRTDSTGDWYVWDSARGIVAGNDPYLLLNSTAAEVTGTDYVDTYSAGFEISSTAPAAINANGGSFIFLAIS